MRLKFTMFLIAACAVGFVLAADPPAKAPAPKAPAAATQAAFDKAVKPLFDSTCSLCHSAAVASGGLNIEQYATVDSLSSGRDEWDKIVQKAKGQAVTVVIVRDHQEKTLSMTPDAKKHS